MKKQIEVITYEQERLNYFTELMKNAQNRYKRLFKKFNNAPYLSEEAQMLSDAGREAQFHGDVVEMLEKGYRKQIDGEWKMKVYPITSCSVCGILRSVEYQQGWNFCPICGAHMKGADT